MIGRIQKESEINFTPWHHWCTSDTPSKKTGLFNAICGGIVNMPRKEGIEAIKEIKADNNPDARILVLTSFAEDEKVYAAIEAGAVGYLLEYSSPREILAAIRQVHLGEPSMNHINADKLMGEIQNSTKLPPTSEPLTIREEEVLKLVAQGMLNQKIAEKLVISERTVRMHVTNILGKLHLANRTQAGLYALIEGLADLDS